MRFREIIKRNKRRYVLETDMAEMRFLIATCTGLSYCDCYRCSFEACCKSRIATGKRDLCMEVANLKKTFLSSLG